MDRYHVSPFKHSYLPNKQHSYSNAGPEISSILRSRNYTPTKSYQYTPQSQRITDNGLSKLSTTSNILPQMQQINSSYNRPIEYTGIPKYDKNFSYYTPKFNIKNNLDPEYVSKILESKQVLMLDSVNKMLQNSLPFNPSFQQIQDSLQEYSQFIQELQNNLLQEQQQSNSLNTPNKIKQNDVRLQVKTEGNEQKSPYENKSNYNDMQKYQEPQENTQKNNQSHQYQQQDPILKEVQHALFLDEQQPQEVKEIFIDQKNSNSAKRYSKEKNKRESSSSSNSPKNKYELQNFESFKPLSKQNTKYNDDEYNVNPLNQQKQESSRDGQYVPIKIPNYEQSRKESDMSDFDNLDDLPKSIGKEKKRVTHDFEPESFKHYRTDSHKKYSLQTSDPIQFQPQSSHKKFSLQANPQQKPIIQQQYDNKDSKIGKNTYNRQQTIDEGPEEQNVQYDFNFSTFKTEGKKTNDSPQSVIQHEESMQKKYLINIDYIRNANGTDDLLDQFKKKAMNLNAEIQNMIDDGQNNKYEFSYQLYQQ